MDKKKLIFIICGIVIAISIIVMGIGVAMYFIQNKDAESSNGTFDIEKVVNNITIDGQPYKWFSSLNELGPDWTWSEFGEPTVMGDDPTEATAVVDYKGEEMFGGSVYNYSQGHERDALFFSMSVSNNRISIDGLKLGDSKQDVLNKYGQPTENRKDGTEKFYYTVEHDSKELSIAFEKDKITYLYLIYRH
jgi:hypothetical protein